MELLNEKLTTKQIGQLVAGLIPRTLPAVTIAEAQRLPRRIHAIYFVFLEEELIYVGQTENLSKRWNSHRLKRDPDCKDAVITYLQIPQPSSCWSLRADLERAFISKYQPVMNQRWPNTSYRNIRYLADAAKEIGL